MQVAWSGTGMFLAAWACCIWATNLEGQGGRRGATIKLGGVWTVCVEDAHACVLGKVGVWSMLGRNLQGVHDVRVHRVWEFVSCGHALE